MFRAKFSVVLSWSRYLSTNSKTAIENDVHYLLEGVLNGNRAQLAKAITLVESKHPIKRSQAQVLLTSLLAHQRKLRQYGRLKGTFRIGLSGSPGAGKSTFIETFGKFLMCSNHKVAVLAVDPSSSRTGGCILGDKTRMPQLAADSNAFIRPSPSSGNLGGVARNTQEAILLCEGAGYDIILVETVGVGQSEVAVVDMVDMFVLLVPPAAGDELQGMKKGIVELADLVLITKADGDLIPAARRIQTEYSSALRLMSRASHSLWRPQVTSISSLHHEGIDQVWDIMKEYMDTMKRNGLFHTKRIDQQRTWLWHHIHWQLMDKFRTNSQISIKLEEYEQQVARGILTPGTAADKLIEYFVKNSSNNTREREY